MRKSVICWLLAVMMILPGGIAAAEGSPVSRQELGEFADRVRALALSGEVMNDPADPEAFSEDGILFQFDFGVVYADQPVLKEDTPVSAFQIMDRDVPGPRGIAVDCDVSAVMAAVPCGNPEMDGSRDLALLYLEGNPAEEFRFGFAERDGQRISAIVYGIADGRTGEKITMTLRISGDGVDAIRVEGLNGGGYAEDLAEFYADLEAAGRVKAYARVPRSLDGSKLEMFQESDLDFSSLSYQTAVPEIFGENVEDVLIDNEDGTWLRRVDGDGFSAVFTCDAQGRNTELISYTILSPDLEGPRAVRLGDLFHEDFQRFRSGEGALSEDGTAETLYGTVGQAPYGLAEYGNGGEMALRYVTDTLSGREVELLLRYEETELTEITLHTL